MRKRLPGLLLLGGVLLAQQPASNAVRPERLPQDTGTAGLNQALRKLKTTARLLQTTAHPDDEDGGMLTYESRGKGVEVMLLTLTRGDGGQNRTGSNLFDELGVLRTLELLESDRYYGVQQRFSRVADFGFTKSAEETFQKWGGHDVPLADMVRVIRTFRPDVVASGWSGTERDGHGQHQAAGLLTPEAVTAAADPKRFPEQIKEGLFPWQVKKLYARSRDEYTLRLEAGKVDPDLGTSYAQFGIEGYSHQKSQGGSVFAARPGPNYRMYKLLTSRLPNHLAAEEQDFFDGLDTTLPGLADGLGAEQSRVPFLRTALKEIEAKVNEAVSTHEAGPILAGWTRLRQTLPLVEQSSLRADAKENLLLRLQEKSAQFEDVARLALGLEFDMLRENGQQMIVPGQTVKLKATFRNGGKVPVSLKQITIEVPDNWKQPPAQNLNKTLRPGESSAADFTLSVPANAKLTRPYWHRSEPDKENLHTIDDPAFNTLPFPLPPIRARARYEAAAASGELNAVAGAKANGKFAALAVVPAFSVFMRPTSQVAVANQKSTISSDVVVRSNLDQKISARVSLSVPSGWSVEPKSQNLNFDRAGEEKLVHFAVVPAAGGETRAVLKAEVQSGGARFAEGFNVVTREDLDTFYFYHPATQKIAMVSAALPPKTLKIGYIMGAGDDILPVLQQLGLDTREISPQELATGDLKHFDTIVLGIRAYDTRDDLRKYNQRLLDFVSQGGTLVVQNNSDSDAGNYAPYPAQISRERVSVEEASVEILAPQDGIFSFPNKITSADFDGWIQERGVNFMSQWDDRYRPLLASADPGEAPLKGGLLRASVAKGTYIYTGYAFFRQLPAGVPGAIRLYVNLLSAGHDR